jgi:hypothetical protein
VTKISRLLPLFAFAAVLPLAAQEDWCSAKSFHTDGMISHAEVREQRLAAAPENVVNPAQNGSIRVHGWNNADIQVKACIQSAAPDENAAERLAKSVTITDGPGRIVAKGPSSRDNSWWSVSYEIWAPASASLELKALNGSIHVEGMAGRIRAQTVNGSLKLKDVGGDVDGETTNGSLSVDLTGSGSRSQSLRLNTVNGSVQLHLPKAFAADAEASTVHGRVQSDFPTEGDPGDKTAGRFGTGAGGAKIEAHTVNGSIHVSQI